ncbi:MAG: tetratricopeptide repeat protein [Mycobacterium leprae]
MTFEELRARIDQFYHERKYAEAETYLSEIQSNFSGKSLGRWHFLYAQSMQRLHPDDRDAFLVHCADAARLLQGDPEGLCHVYLTQISASISWGDWHTARVHIRRLRAMARRHQSDFSIQKLQGIVLFNEGLVERAAGNFLRAVELLQKGVEITNRVLFPVNEHTRSVYCTMAHLNIADSYLRIGQHGKAIEAMSRVDPTKASWESPAQYYYVQSRYWLALGHLDKAAEWIGQAEHGESWDPDQPALILEVRAQIARAQGDADQANRLLEKALEHTAKRKNHVLTAVLLRELQEQKKELKS